MNRWALGVLLVAALAAGCAAPGRTLAVENASPTPTPRGACPTVPGEAVPPDACVPYDGEAAMRANEAYRQRGELPPDVAAIGEEHRARIAALLTAAVRERPLDYDRVVATLTADGYARESVQAYGSSDGPGGLAVGVATDGGCVFGGVRGTEVQLEVGAGIADGGCLPAQGH